MSSPVSPDSDLRAARRTLTLFVVALAVAAVALVVLLSGVVDEEAGDTTVGAGGEGTVVAIGPESGVDAAAYVDARRERLTKVEGPRAAVVSFTDYVAETEVADRLGDAVEPRQLLVALPDDEPRVVETVQAARDVAVADAESQLEEIAGLVNTVDDEEFAAFYRQEMLRYRELLDGAGRDDVVFGAVVVAGASDLRAVASRAGVRLVDVGAGDDLADDAILIGLRPEESLTTGEPQFRR